MNNKLSIRLGRKEDAKGVLAIYKHYVIHTAITFEYEVPSIEEMENRIINILKKYPYLVCEDDDKIVGYAYASDFRHRAAYQWSPESAIYLSNAIQGKGIGKILYQTLFDVLRFQGFYNVFAGVALPNEASIKLHLKLAFEEIGDYKNIGYKHGKWHTTKWFQLALKDYGVDPETPELIEDVKDSKAFYEILNIANKQLNK
ncbi:MAG: N-acetyltransferase [Phycisphaerae bacterium]|nr:N-acetyltransferase [Saprospiraceae bacterium]